MQELCVLHVTPYSGRAWAYGGIPRLAHTMARHLAGRGHQVTVCATDVCDADSRLVPDQPPVRRFGAWAPIEEEDGVTLRVFPNVSNRLAYHQQAFAPIGFGSFLKTHARSFDIAHLHACRNLPGVIAARQLRDAGVPYVLAPNGTAPNIESRRLAKRAFDLLMGDGVARHASRILAVTDVERRQLLEAGVDAGRIRVVPNPLDLAEFDRPGTPGAFRARHGIVGPLVAFLGKITPRKRVDLLIRAFAGLPQTDATLVIAGNDMGAGAAAVRAAAATGTAPRTRFVGLLKGHERLQLLADADVVVYPSEHEIFGLVPLEALLVGTPVVVADDSGCGEVIGATGGGLVVPGSEDALRQAIDAVLRRPDVWRPAAAAAGLLVRARFAADAIAAQLEDVYADVVRTH
jgi:glycosyltransferase involved in cell wall biosynthesis